MKTDSEVMSLLSEHKMLMKLSTHKKQDDASYKVCIIYRYQLICTRKSNLALTNLYFTEYSKHVKAQTFHTHPTCLYYMVLFKLYHKTPNKMKVTRQQFNEAHKNKTEKMVKKKTGKPFQIMNVHFTLSNFNLNPYDNLSKLMATQFGFL